MKMKNAWALQAWQAKSRKKRRNVNRIEEILKNSGMECYGG